MISIILLTSVSHSWFSWPARWQRQQNRILSSSSSVLILSSSPWVLHLSSSSSASTISDTSLSLHTILNQSSSPSPDSKSVRAGWVGLRLPGRAGRERRREVSVSLNWSSLSSISCSLRMSLSTLSTSS